MGRRVHCTGFAQSGDPLEGVRSLCGFVRSVALYGALVWQHRLTGVRRFSPLNMALQRRMATRIARGYRTVFFDPATVLARFPLLDILTVWTRVRVPPPVEGSCAAAHALVGAPDGIRGVAREAGTAVDHTPVGTLARMNGSSLRSCPATKSG